MFIYGVFDRKSRRYTNTYTDFKDESAERTFIALCQDPHTYVGMFPEDYELWVLANLDEETGIIIPGKEYITTGRKEIKPNVLFKNEQATDNT